MVLQLLFTFCLRFKLGLGGSGRYKPQTIKVNNE
nr:MAG TPA: hypothetical protein [Caudoviricetes sp.]